MAASMALAGRACACWLLAIWMVSCTFDAAAAAAFPTISPVFAPLRADKITPAAVRSRALRDLTLPAAASQQQQPSSDRPLLQTSRPHTIAHRGASGLLPEHTMAGYRLAIAQQADFVECDVVVTRDLALICRHEPNLNATTNAWTLFPDRARTVIIDGEAVSGIFAADLTLAEVRQLSARQRWPFRPQPDEAAGERHSVPTFGEFLDVVTSYSERAVGIYPEVKHPTWHNQWLAAFNTTIEELVVEQLHAHGYGSSAPFGSPAWRARPALIQSFEASSLRRLAGMTRVPLVLLLGGWPGFVAPDSGLSHEEMTSSDEFLADLATFAVGAGPWKSSLYSITPAPGTGGSSSGGGAVGGAAVEDDSSSGTTSSSGGDHLTHPDIGRAHEPASVAGPAGIDSSGSVPPVQRVSTGLAAKLHKHGLVVHPYTLRDEQQFVVDGCTDIACELGWLFDKEGVDGGFSDFPGTLASWLLARERRQAAVQE